MKKSFFIVLLFILTSLVACGNVDEGSGESSDDKENIGDVPVYEEEEGSSDEGSLEEGNLPSKEEYNYNDYITDGDKIDFYKNKEILLGEEFDQKEESYLVYMFSPLCTYCDDFYDTLSKYEELESSYPIYKINVDVRENIGVWEKFNLEGTPTLLLVDKEEETILKSFVGVQPFEDLPVRE